MTDFLAALGLVFAIEGLLFASIPEIAKEALRAVLAHGFDVVGLHRIEAQHFKENPASGAVMRKAGMTHEGRLRGVVFRDGVPRDNELYAMLRSDPRP